MSKFTKEEKAQSLEWLRSVLKPGDTVYTVLRSVSPSGMSRRISCFVVTAKGAPIDLTYQMALLGIAGMSKFENGKGAIIRGCGMDMGFHAVYNLGKTLWPDGLEEPHGLRNGLPDYDGGYALRHQWFL